MRRERDLVWVVFATFLGLFAGVLLGLFLCPAVARGAQPLPLHELLAKRSWPLRVAELPGWKLIEVKQTRGQLDAWGYFWSEDRDCTFTLYNDGVYREQCATKSGRIELELGLDRLLRYDTLAHEYGHAFSHMQMTQEQRDRFRAVMRYDDRDWWVEGGREGASLEELFADAYSWCSLRAKQRRQLGIQFDDETGRWRPTTYGLEMSRPQARAVCGMLR